MKDENNETDEWKDTIITAALVLRLPLEELSNLKKLIKKHPSTQIVYQRVSVGHLSIVEGD